MFRARHTSKHMTTHTTYPAAPDLQGLAAGLASSAVGA